MNNVYYIKQSKHSKDKKPSLPQKKHASRYDGKMRTVREC